MSACLQVKAILLKEGVEEGMKEIRRFRMDEERGGGMGGRQRLQSLLTHVHSVFNVNTATQRCTLYWKDEDGDLIQFSTEEELSHALDTMRDGTFRLYVTLSEDQAETSEEEQMTERHVTFDFTPELYCTDPDSVARLSCPGRGGRHCHSHRGRKGERATCKAKDAEKNKEFKEVRQQVPAEFRKWVRQYVRTWYTQGPEAAQNSAKGEKLPEGVGHDFPQWLDTFLHHHPLPHPSGDGKMEVEDLEGMEGEGLEGLPPLYFRWLAMYLPRFHACFSRRRAASADSENEEKGGACREGHRRKGHKGHGKHGCHGKKGGKHGVYCTSSESEESDGGHKAHKQVPKEFRKYARVTVKQLHKSKGNNSDNKEKATRAGVPAEVQKFVEQILLEWHAKLSSKSPRAVAMEIMAGERSLPAGMEQEHFLWLCRFLSRWHRRHAGKCDVMSGWSSGETTSDETSGEETTPLEHGQDCGPWPHNRREFRTIMKMVGRHPRGMMGHPHFAMYPGMGHPFFTPPHARGCGPRCGAKRFNRMGGCGPHESCKRWKERHGAGQGEASGVQDESVSHVTEGVKKM